jgi:hypothetical protein
VLGSPLPSVVGRARAGGHGVSALGVGGSSRLARTPGSLMQAGLQLLFVRIVLLNLLTAWSSGCLSLILC